MSRVSRNKVKRKKWKIWIISILSVIALVVLSAAIFFVIFYQDAKQTVNKKMHEPVHTIDTDLTKRKVKSKKPLNILLLGIDSEQGDAGRSDAIMIMQLQPETNSMQLVSIPRDTRTLIVGKGFEDKINHAYAFGERGNRAAMSVATVEHFLDIELDYYVSINMSGLVELVNELGTITVNNDVAWSDGKYDFPKGELVLDGEKTKAYVRMRKKDPSGDFGRTTRQRKVIEAIVNEGASIGSIPKFGSILEVLGNNMRTNMDFDDMKKLFLGYADTRKNIAEHMIKGSGKMIPNSAGQNIYYLIVPEDERLKAHDILMEHNPS